MNIKKTASILAGAGTGVLIGKAIKGKKICPACIAKKAFAATQVHVADVEKYNNGVALTPPMGWSSWNTFRNSIDEKLIKDTAERYFSTPLFDE